MTEVLTPFPIWPWHMRPQFEIEMKPTRTEISNEPKTEGWYGILYSDGEGEVWTGAAYCMIWKLNPLWIKNINLAYARSIEAFATKELAEAWASSQPD